MKQFGQRYEKQLKNQFPPWVYELASAEEVLKTDEQYATRLAKIICNFWTMWNKRERVQDKSKELNNDPASLKQFIDSDSGEESSPVKKRLKKTGNSSTSS
jgi:Golgi nucleoside diphosphatase